MLRSGEVQMDSTVSSCPRRPLRCRDESFGHVFIRAKTSACLSLRHLARGQARGEVCYPLLMG